MLGYYTAPAGVGEIKPLVYTALHRLIATHPMLSAIAIHENSDRPVFVRVPFVDLDKAVTFHSGAPPDFNAFLEAQHNETFTQPFWRLVVHSLSENRFMVSFLFHHGIGDGGSGMSFHRGFLRALPTYVVAEVVVARVVPPASPLLPSLEQFYDTGKLPAAPAANLPEGLWTSKPISDVDLRTRSSTVWLPEVTLKRMVARCKAEGTTITAFFHAVIAKAYLNILGSEFSGLRLAGAMSMRRYLPASSGITEDSVGCWVTGFSDNYWRGGFEEGGVWGEARRGRKFLQMLVETGNRKGIIGRAPKAQMFKEKVGARRVRGAVEISNLGVFDGRGSDGGWSVERVFFSQSASVVGAAIEFSVVSVLGGEVGIGAAWQECVISTEVVERGMAEMEREIDAALV